MKKALLICTMAFLSGCATHAQIEMPVVTQAYNGAYENKTFTTETVYSQPMPGMFTGGEQQPLLPLEEAKVSIASARVLRNLPEYIRRQLPASAKLASTGDGDFKVRVEITAYNKKGPAYAEYRPILSFVTAVFTLGLAPSEYYLDTDFKIRLILSQGGTEVYRKTYMCQEQLVHQVNGFERSPTLSDTPAQLLEKHLILTFNTFFREASTHLKT